MEKYRKFDDPSCGLNPFVPLDPPHKLEGWKKPARYIVGWFLTFIRVPCVILGIWVGLILHCFKFLAIHPGCIRWFECFYDRMYTNLIISTASFSNMKETYHREHKDFNFIKE